MSDIFLSYANEDRPRIIPLAQALEASGWSVFWDRTIPAGRTWRQVIAREIKSCHCVIVVWTQHSVDSSWVHEEAEEGKRRDILLPVIFDNVAPPFGFGNIQAADLTGWNGSPDAAAFQRLIMDATGISGMPPRPRVAAREEARPAAAEHRRPPETARTREQRPRREEAATTTPSSVPHSGWRPGPWFKVAAAGVGVVIGVAALVFMSQGEREGPPLRTSQAEAPPAKATVPAVAVTPAALKPRQEPDISPVSLTAPPAGYFVLDTIGRKPDTSVRLAEISARRNQVTDGEEWWAGNRLDPLTYQVPNPFRQIEGDLPGVVPTRFRSLRIVEAIRSNPVLAIYGEDFSEGRYLLAVNPSSGQVAFAMDFSAFLWPREFNQSDRNYVRMRTSWAHLEAGVLYVSHSHSTYARSSKGFNAYISAIDVRSGTLLWRSQPLVSNAGNFIVKGDAIIAGYGFTAEPDFMYVLNKADGRIVQRVPVKSGPSHLVEKDNRLFVRTYDTDYVFRYASQ